MIEGGYMASSNNKTNNKVKSKYNRYESTSAPKKKNGIYKKKSNDIEVLEDLDSTRNLDVSFVEGIGKKKALEEKTEILDVYEINRANEEFKESLDLNNRLSLCSYLLLFFLIISLSLVIFIIYHYISFDHTKTKVIEKNIVKEVEVVDSNYVFLGDSITEYYDLDEYYPDIPVVNSGYAGYATNDIIDNLNEYVYQYNPSKVFVLIGTNDIEEDGTVDGIVSNIEVIIDGIKKNRPYCKIYLQSIYPVDKAGKRDNKTISKINAKLEELSLEKDIVYIDVYSQLVDDDDILKSEYTTDGLHISDAGYKKITSILKKYIEE